MTTSAGILVYRRAGDGLEVLIGHMGGPFWARKDARGWSIFKGGFEPPEEPFDAACREFTEETGQPIPPGPVLALGEIRQGSGKRVQAWAVEGELDPATLRSNTFEMEWPPRSGRMQAYPEIDRFAWVGAGEAREKLVKGQVAFIDRLEAELGVKEA